MIMITNKKCIVGCPKVKRKESDKESDKTWTSDEVKEKIEVEKIRYAEIWKLQICDSALDMVHGNFRMIVEIYIPSEKIACNLIDGFHCFKVESDRYKTDGYAKAVLIKKLSVPCEIVNAFKQYIDLQRSIYGLLLNNKDIRNSFSVKIKGT